MIPETIHHIVGQKTNAIIDQCLESWTILRQAGYDINIWTDESIAIFLTENYEFALNAFLNARNHAEAADIARYLIIHHFGGHYIDWDVQLLEPNKFLKISYKNPNGYFIIDPANNTLASEMFGAIPKCDFLLKLSVDIVNLYDSTERNKMGTPQYSGPFRMRDSLKEFGAISQALIPVKSIFAYDYSEIRNRPSRKISQPVIHYWLHTWVKC